VKPAFASRLLVTSALLVPLVAVSCNSASSSESSVTTAPNGPETAGEPGAITPGEVNGTINSSRMAAAMANLVVDAVVNDDDTVTVVRVLRGTANQGDRIPVDTEDDALLVAGAHKFVFLDTTGARNEITFFTSSERVALRLAAGMDLADRLSDEQLESLVVDREVRAIVAGRIVPNPDDPYRATIDVDSILKSVDPGVSLDVLDVVRIDPVDDRPGGPWLFEVSDGSWNTGVSGVLFLGRETDRGYEVLNPTEPWLVSVDAVIKAITG